MHRKLTANCCLSRLLEVHSLSINFVASASKMFKVNFRFLRTVPQVPRSVNSHSSRRAMCAASFLRRVRSAAVTWITRCGWLNLLTFDEFERMMRIVKNCFGNSKTLGNNVLKLRTNMHLIDDLWR